MNPPKMDASQIRDGGDPSRVSKMPEDRFQFSAHTSRKTDKIMKVESIGESCLHVLSCLTFPDVRTKLYFQ